MVVDVPASVAPRPPLSVTVPAATAEHAAFAADTGTGLIAGTTGLEPDQEAAILSAAENTAIVRAANMSVGVNVLLAITRQVAGLLDPGVRPLEVVTRADLAIGLVERIAQFMLIHFGYDVEGWHGGTSPSGWSSCYRGSPPEAPAV